MGKHDFRVLFIDRYVCICHLADASKNYIYHILGMEQAAAYSVYCPPYTLPF